MITELYSKLETGKNYLLVFDLPRMTPDVLQRIANRTDIKNAFIEEYQKTSDFELLDSAAKNPRESAANQFIALVRIEAAVELKTVCETILSLIAIVTTFYLTMRFRFAEVTTSGI